MYQAFPRLAKRRNLNLPRRAHMPSRDDYRVLDFNVRGKGGDAEQVN